jgi:peptidyl-prolyl cis-trans isomerase SurA
MKRTVFTLLSLCLACTVFGGCAKNKALVKTEPRTPAVKVEQPKADLPAPFMASGKMLNAIVAVVNDEIITLYDVNSEAQPIISENEKKAPLDDGERKRIRRVVLDGLVEKKLIEQKIKELNVVVSEAEILQAMEDVKRQNSLDQEGLVKALAAQGVSYDQYRSQLHGQLERLKLVSMEVKSRIQVGESEVRAYYDTNLDVYREEDSFRARHIFFKTSEKAPAEDIKRSMTTALNVLAEAKSGKDFAELAKQYSEDPAARKDGGDLGSFKKGDMQPELEQAILNLKPGEVSELVYTPLGFHLIKLEERINGKPKPFERVKSEIEETIYKKKSEERFSAWAKELRSKANIELKELPGIM